MTLDPWNEHYENLRRRAEEDMGWNRPHRFLDALAWIVVWGVFLMFVGLGVFMLVSDNTVGGLLGIYLIAGGLWWLWSFLTPDV